MTKDAVLVEPSKTSLYPNGPLLYLLTLLFFCSWERSAMIQNKFPIFNTVPTWPSETRTYSRAMRSVPILLIDDRNRDPPHSPDEVCCYCLPVLANNVYTSVSNSYQPQTDIFAWSTHSSPSTIQRNRYSPRFALGPSIDSIQQTIRLSYGMA